MMLRFSAHLVVAFRGLPWRHVPGCLVGLLSLAREFAGTKKGRLNRVALRVRIVLCCLSVWHDPCRRGEAAPFVAVNLCPGWDRRLCLSELGAGRVIDGWSAAYSAYRAPVRNEIGCPILGWPTSPFVSDGRIVVAVGLQVLRTTDVVAYVDTAQSCCGLGPTATGWLAPM